VNYRLKLETQVKFDHFETFIVVNYMINKFNCIFNRNVVEKIKKIDASK